MATQPSIDDVGNFFNSRTIKTINRDWNNLLTPLGVASEQAAFSIVARRDILGILQPRKDEPAGAPAVVAGFFYRDNDGNGQFTPGEAINGSLLGLPTLDGAKATIKTYGNCFFFGPLAPGQSVTLKYKLHGVKPFSRKITLQPGLNLVHVPLKMLKTLSYVIPHSHFDPEWRDTYEGYLATELPQLISRIRLLREQPTHHFAMDEEAVLRPLVERHPEILDELRQRVIEGCIEIKGIIIMGELTMPLGESQIRQMTEGEQWASRLLGMDIKPDVYWNIDCYGLNFQLPQILAKAGREYFVMGEYNHYGGAKQCGDILPFSEPRVWENPDFWLEGLDGSKVLMHRSIYGTEPKGVQEWYKDVRSHNSAFNFQGGDFVPPDPELPGLLTELNKDPEHSKKYEDQTTTWGLPLMTHRAGECKFVIGTSPQYFNAIENAPDLPTFRTESYLSFWSGCYESRSRGRLASRELESTLLAAESLSAAAMLAGAAYPIDPIREAWYLLLINHDHDPQLTVMSPNYLFCEVLERYDTLRVLAHEALNQSAAALAKAARTNAQSGTPVVVCNPLPWTQTQSVEIDCDADTARVVDAKGKEMPAQIFRDKCGKTKVGFLATNLPGAGWRTCYVQPDKKPRVKTSLSASENILENAHVRVELADGLVRKITEKSSGRAVFQTSKSAAVNEVFIWEDLGCIAQIRPVNFMSEAKLVARSSQAKRTTRLKASGPARAIVETSFTLDRGKFTQQIILDADAAFIDFVTTVDWDSGDVGKRRVRVAFPTPIKNPAVWRSIPFAVVPWEQTDKILPVNSWLGVSDKRETIGGAVIHSGMSSAQVIDNVLWQTLFRSVRMDGEAEDKIIDRPCVWDVSGDRALNDGIFSYSYRAPVFAGSWRQAGVPRLAAHLTTPTIATAARPHKGTIGDEGGLLSIEPVEISASAFKKCDYSDDTLLRLYNTTGKKIDAVLRVGFKVSAVDETNFREEHTGDLTIKNGRVSLTFSPHEIKTVRLRK